VVDPVSPVSAFSLSRRPSVSNTDVDDSSEPAPKKAKVTSSSTRRLHNRFPDGKFPEFQRHVPSFSPTRSMVYFTLSVADLPPAARIAGWYYPFFLDPARIPTDSTDPCLFDQNGPTLTTARKQLYNLEHQQFLDKDRKFVDIFYQLLDRCSWIMLAC
jgi:hypothetical protein